jgi:hypothetical protein
MDSSKLASSDDDVASAAAPPRVRVAGAVMLMAGLFGVLHVVQLFNVITYIRGPFVVVPYLLGALAVATVIIGVAFARTRGWAAVAGIVATGLLAVTSGAWFVFAILNGIFTLFGMVEPGLAVLALALAVVARGACESASAARKRLERAGFQLGV